MPDSSLYGDVLLEDHSILVNSTFNINALNRTLEHLVTTNFWNLYDIAHSKVPVRRFDIPFRDFKSEYRTQNESELRLYPRRFISYVEHEFIPTSKRKKYRQSDSYNKALNQSDISRHPELFNYNFLMFIGGYYIATSEILPREDKLGIIIDVANGNHTHGIPYSDYKKFYENNEMVTIFIIPNFDYSTATTNRNVISAYNNKIPLDKLVRGDALSMNTLVFSNFDDSGISTKRYLENIVVDENETVLDFKSLDGLEEVKKSFQFSFITFHLLNGIMRVDGLRPYFQIKTKMPCPKENLLIFVRDRNGNYTFDQTLSIEMYYPNIYKIVGLKQTDTALIYSFYDDSGITENEKYKNEIEYYERYVDLLPRYKSNIIEDVLKNYKPADYQYSIDNFNDSVFVPSTINYKIDKLKDTILKSPWSLNTYLNFLNLPNDKYYIDMEQIDLEDRIRISTEDESEDGLPVIEFEEDRYVFAMSKQFLNQNAYAFRIFIDGYFQKEGSYLILEGTDFYYIYIPVNKIKKDTIIEIEKYRLYDTREMYPFKSLDDYFEFRIAKEGNSLYVKDIFLVNDYTGQYLPKDSYRIEVFTPVTNEYIAVDGNAFATLAYPVRIYITDPELIRKKIRICIHRAASMAIGEPYVPQQDTKYCYTYVRIKNSGNYDNMSYRVFKNGLLTIPPQWDLRQSGFQGDMDEIRTKCSVVEGDQFTVDHVPSTLRVVYYQNEITDPKGYVDLDGKLELPISLNWYDIYLNGVKLNKKNLDIISPTRFYVQNVTSRKHLVIIDRNRDNDVFYLAKHKAGEYPDENNTIMDDIFDALNGFKQIVDATKKNIPIGEDMTGDGIYGDNVIDALIFFEEYLRYTFINANWKQLTQKIKEKFSVLINEYGVMPIDSNIHPNAKLLKVIDCNKGVENMALPVPIGGYEGIKELQDRFAVTPLHTSNHDYALNGEYLIDDNTGSPAIKRDDGSIVSIGELGRMKEHLSQFETNLIYYNMGRSQIFLMNFNDDSKVKEYDGTNILDEDVQITKSLKQICLSIDATILTKSGSSNILKIADIDPVIKIVYAINNGEDKQISYTLSDLKNHPVFINGTVTIKEIKFEDDLSSYITFIHSILIAIL